MKRPTPKLKMRQIRIARENLNRRRLRRLSKRVRQRLVSDALAKRRLFAAQHNVLFVQDLSRHQIVLPALLSLSDAYAETVRVIEELRHTVFIERKPAVLHFENVQKIEPSAALLLVSEIYRCRHLRKTQTGHSVDGVYPIDLGVDRQLADMGFYKLLNVTPRKETKNTRPSLRPVFLPFLTGVLVDAEMINTFVEIIEKFGILVLNDAARRKLIGALVEAMSNANEHAYKSNTIFPYMPRRWWLSASVDVSNHEVTVILCDQGVGIAGTLDVGLFEGLKIHVKRLEWLDLLFLNRSDGVLIKAATELFRTGTGQSGRGKGFRDMKAFVDRCSDGELRVLSNRGRYHYVGGTDSSVENSEEFGDEALSIGGTLIEWRIRNADKMVMEDD